MRGYRYLRPSRPLCRNLEISCGVVQDAVTVKETVTFWKRSIGVKFGPGEKLSLVDLHSNLERFRLPPLETLYARSEEIKATG